MRNFRSEESAVPDIERGVPCPGRGVRLPGEEDGFRFGEQTSAEECDVSGDISAGDLKRLVDFLQTARKLRKTEIHCASFPFVPGS